MSLFKVFCGATKKVSPSRTEGQRKAGAPAGPMDWPMLRYIMSLELRTKCVNYSLRRVESANVLAAEEIEETNKQGMGTYDPFLILVYYYESLVDQIYKAMENVAKVNIFLYDSKHPPHTFEDQMTKIRNGILKLSESYDRVMMDKMDWYREIPPIRNNSNHYIIGTGVYKRDDKGTPILQYLYYEISERKENRGETGKIEKDILDSARSLCTRFNSCMDDICSAWLQEVDPTEACTIPFIYSDRIETRRISLGEYRAGQDGELMATMKFKQAGQS
jgi:hypothetical protein